MNVLNGAEEIGMGDNSVMLVRILSKFLVRGIGVLTKQLYQVVE